MMFSNRESLVKCHGRRFKTFCYRHIFYLDRTLLILLMIYLSLGLFILYSAGEQNIHLWFAQVLRLGFGCTLMLIASCIEPRHYQKWSPLFYLMTLVMLIIVGIKGHIGKGAQRWLNLGIVHFEPSEMMKLALPMILAHYLNDKHLPPSTKNLSMAMLLIALPVILVVKQPDLGTAIMLSTCGSMVLILADLPWKKIRYTLVTILAALPIVWRFMHQYQRQRVLTFLNPQSDPMGSGYHIIQSKIAVGSGGLWGKGWFNGSQSHFKFLPEHTTDFIFSVAAEEFGFMGSICFIIIITLITLRLLQLGMQGNDTFTRLLACSLGIMFFISCLINIGMVSGIFPVVGLPLPLISYGGSCIVTYMTGFGIVMSCYRYRKRNGEV